MEMTHDLDDTGTFDAKYRAFLESLREVRPKLHRYCGRMLGSLLDGEDVAQEVLFEAYRKLDQLDDTRPLAPWLFRIAHNRCIDHLRRRAVPAEGTEHDAAVPPAEPIGRDLGRAIERLVVALPPMERASLLLKDVLDCSLEETAEILETTVGGTKSALHRGRSRLAALPAEAPPPRQTSADEVTLLEAYVAHFNRQDWDGLRKMIATDARTRAGDYFAGKIFESGYFSWYASPERTLRASLGAVEGEPVVVVEMQHGAGWQRHTIVRLAARADGLVSSLRDYWASPWLVAQA